MRNSLAITALVLVAGTTLVAIGTTSMAAPSWNDADDRMNGEGKQFNGEVMHRCMNAENRDAVREAIEANDYDAFVEVAGESKLEVIDSLEKFELLVQAHTARMEGDHETASAIAQELGLPMNKRMKMRKGHQGMGQMKEIMDTANYDLFVEQAPDRMLEIIDSVEDFNTLVEAHNARMNGDYDTARELHEELGLPQKRGHGDRMGMGNQ